MATSKETTKKTTTLKDITPVEDTKTQVEEKREQVEQGEQEEKRELVDSSKETNVQTEQSNKSNKSDDLPIDDPSIKDKLIKRPEIPNTTTGIAYNVMLLIITFIASKIVPLINKLLGSILSNIMGLKKPNVNDEYSKNKVIIQAINMSLSDPQIIAEWEKTARIIALYIKTLTEKINDEVLEEVDETLKKLVSILERNTKSAVLNIATSIITAICAIPIVAPFCEGLDLISVIISSSANSVNTILSLLDATSKIIGVFSTVVGDKIGGLEEIAGLINNMIATISVATDIINSGTDKMDNFNDSIKKEIKSYQVSQ
jgi:hypothetical protein